MAEPIEQRDEDPERNAHELDGAGNRSSGGWFGLM